MLKYITAIIAIGVGVLVLQTQELQSINIKYLNTISRNIQRGISSLPSPNDPLKIHAVGDIMLASTYPNTSRMPPQNGKTVLEKVSNILSSADLTFGNLEGPLIDGGVSGKCRPGSTQCFAFKTPTSYGKYLKQAGFDVLSLANNHAGDFGAAGRESTRKTLENLGIAHAGSDKDEYASTIIHTNGYKVGVLAFGHNPGMPSINNVEKAAEYVQELDKEVDIILVSFHGGAEGSGRGMVPSRNEIFLGENRGNLPLFAKTVIDAGADAVIGHGPHILRGIDVYKDRPILYSTGNFATYGWFQLYGATALTGVFEINLYADGSLKEGVIHPHIIKNRGIPEFDENNQAIKEIQRLSSINFPNSQLQIQDDGSFFIQ